MNAHDDASGVSDPLAVAEALLADDDIAGLIRHLRMNGDQLPLADVARVLRTAAQVAGFDDLAEAADDVVMADGDPNATADEGPNATADGDPNATVDGDPNAMADGGPNATGRAQALFDFGYACVERGIAFLAIRPLSAAVELEPRAVPIRTELAVAYEREGRHREAVGVLRGYDGELPWLARYQLAYNAILAGDLVEAEAAYAALPAPDEESWAEAREKVRAMLVRAAAARVRDGGLGTQDLRGWHFALTGGLLINISPWAFDAGMNGRWAMVGDSYASCSEALRRVGVVLGCAGVVLGHAGAALEHAEVMLERAEVELEARGLRTRLQSVSLLPDRDSEILGLAAARYFGLPAVAFAPERPDTLVVAYDLNACDGETLAALRERVPGQILFERATNWTDPPLVAADICGFLRQTVTTPWDAKLRVVDGAAVRTEADTRPSEEIAAELAATTPEVDEGDGETPPDPDEALVGLGFLDAVGETWMIAAREYVGSAGPVASSRFL